MLDALLLAVTLVGGALPAADTVVALRRGDRVVFENLVGEIVVQAWGRDELEIWRGDDEAELMVLRSGSTVRIVRDDAKGRRRSVEALIRVPAWVDIEIGGPSLEVFVEGVQGRLSVRNVRGDILIRDAGGMVDLRTIEGEIEVRGAAAGVTASSQSDDVTLYNVSGPVSVHSGSGDIELVDIRSEAVRAETQDGDIVFSGTVARGGDYGFYVHDGDAIIAIPSGSNARVSVSTFDGEFESEFLVTIERFTGGREFDFVLGEGGARIQIQVFDGEIRLLQRR